MSRRRWSWTQAPSASRSGTPLPIPLIAGAAPAERFRALLPRNVYVIAAAVAALLLLGTTAAFALTRGKGHSKVSGPCAGQLCTPTGTATAALNSPGLTPPSTADVQPSPPPRTIQAGTLQPATGTLPGVATETPAALPTPPRTTLAFISPNTDGSPKYPARSRPLRLQQAATAAPAGPVSVTPSVTGGTATETPIDTASPSATASGTPVPGASATSMPDATATPTAAPLRSSTPAPSDTPRPTNTPAPSATAILTNTPVPSNTPGPTFTAMPTSGAAPSPSAQSPAAMPTATGPSSGPSPTALVVSVRFAYSFTDDAFVLRWEGLNATGLTLDGHAEAVNGSRSYPLRTHTFVITAIAADGAQALRVVALHVIGDCQVLVNGQSVEVKAPHCSTASATATPTGGSAPAASPTPPQSTPIPAAQDTRPAPTPLPSATTIPTNSPAPSATPPPPTDTPTTVPSRTPFPTDTPSFTPLPTNTAVPSETPIPSPTASATASASATPTQSATPSLTPIPSPTPTLSPSITPSPAISNTATPKPSPTGPAPL